MSRDLSCVYRARDVGEGDILVAWLAEQGIAAMVKNRFMAGTLQVSQIVAPLGIEVCVIDPTQADAARSLLSEHATERVMNRDAAIDATCEECGRTSRFTGAERGSVQSCPHCRAYLDVP